MNKKFMIFAVAVLLVGAIAFMGTSPVLACGSSKTTAAKADGSCAGKATAQTASASDGCASKVNASNASATCDKSSCDKAKAMTASASGSCDKSSCDKAKAMNASADGHCSKANAMNAASVGSAGECPYAKDACINWLMANKDMTKTQAEAAYVHCAKSKAEAKAAVELAATQSSDEAVEVKAVSADGSSN